MMPNITKKQFDAACDKYKPSKWILFAFKYFSKNTEKKDMALSNGIVYFLLSMFGIGFIATIVKLPRKLIMIVTLLYSIILTILVLYLFTAAILNMIRIKKIIKELGVTPEEYDKLVEKYYGN